ncbi:MAG: FHA domain-containing protein, partial [Proteobacteria bacterium]|nr:FHA domain-containing protein [Pseudomonadota bacterium]
MPSIIIRRDGKPTREVALEKDLTLIGQKADADINIEDPDAIGERASILQLGDDFIFNELCPASGTLVNGQPVKKCVLKDRDLITIGEYRMTFQDKHGTDKPLGIEMEAAEIQSLEDLLRSAGKPVDPLLAGPNKRTELVTYAVIGVA